MYVWNNPYFVSGIHNEFNVNLERAVSRTFDFIECRTFDFNLNYSTVTNYRYI